MGKIVEREGNKLSMEVNPTREEWEKKLKKLQGIIYKRYGWRVKEIKVSENSSRLVCEAEHKVQ